MRIAIVTGASSGLGREFVRRLDQQDHPEEIWVIARREDRLRALQAEVSARVRPLALDLTEKAAARTLAETLERERPQVQTLVHAAGFGKIGSWADIPLEECERMIDLNCRAAVAVTQTVLPWMGPGSRVLEICSTAAFQPFPYLNLYAASKAFLYRYSRALRVELLPRHISVTAVCPYWIRDTEFISTARQTEADTRIRHFPLASREATVVRLALRDAGLRLPVSTPGPVCFFHRIAAKVIPSEVMMGLWAGLRRL